MTDGQLVLDSAVRRPALALSRLISGQSGALLIAVILIAVVAQLGNGVFLTESNLVALLRAAVTTFVIGCAATVVFTGGGLDLSVGAVFTLGAVVAGALMKTGIPWPVATCAGLAAGILLGLVNAGLVIVARVPPIIATLSALYAVSGLALVVTDGNFVAPLPEAFRAVGQSTVGPIPLLIVYATAIGMAFHLLLTRTAFGFDVKVIGGNESAARANGVAVNRTKTWIYAISGGVAALAGILYAARTGTADPQAGGADITLQVIAAVLIGGTSLFGGIGTIAGTALGAILFAEIQNALAVLGVNPLYQNIVIGVVLAAAVTTDTWRRSHAFNRRATRR